MHAASLVRECNTIHTRATATKLKVFFQTFSSFCPVSELVQKSATPSLGQCRVRRWLHACSIVYIFPNSLLGWQRNSAVQVGGRMRGDWRSSGHIIVRFCSGPSRPCSETAMRLWRNRVCAFICSFHSWHVEPVNRLCILGAWEHQGSSGGSRPKAVRRKSPVHSKGSSQHHSRHLSFRGHAK